MLDNFLNDLNLEPVAKVTNNLIDKLRISIGFIFLPRGKYLHKIESEKIFLEEIKNREDIDILTKAAIVSNTRKIIKEYINQNDIVQIAINNLNKDAKPYEIDDDWIMDFMDKCKNICDENIKLIWGKILAEECNNKNSVPRKVFNIIPYINHQEANSFEKICTFNVYKKTTNEIFPYIEYFNCNMKNFWSNYNFSLDEFRRLEEIGLIFYKEDGIYIDKKEDEIFVINGENIEVFSSWSERIYVGNVIYTKVGQCIAKIINTNCKIEGFKEAVIQSLNIKNFGDML